MVRKILITEDETNNISNQHSEIDRKLMTFLLRRVEKKERQIGYGDEYAFTVIEISFSDLPGYGFNTFSSRKDMERNMINMLYENDVIGDEVYDFKNELDTNRQKIVKTIRAFLNFILPKK
jgi:hypothetical protein